MIGAAMKRILFGTIEPVPPFGGYGEPSIHTRPNLFGGVTIDQGFGRRRIETRPNVFAGVDCR